MTVAHVFGQVVRCDARRRTSDQPLRWRILLRMRRFLRPTLRRPDPRRRLPMKRWPLTKGSKDRIIGTPREQASE
jgi:hypothetical protein